MSSGTQHTALVSRAMPGGAGHKRKAGNPPPSDSSSSRPTTGTAVAPPGAASSNKRRSGSAKTKKNAPPSKQRGGRREQRPLMAPTTTKTAARVKGHTRMGSSCRGGRVTGWAAEGQRRVRSVEVLSKMRYLTGVAAIGGFLFGYDTGESDDVRNCRRDMVYIGLEPKNDCCSHSFLTVYVRKCR